jgi:hypothetical protein
MSNSRKKCLKKTSNANRNHSTLSKKELCSVKTWLGPGVGITQDVQSKPVPLYERTSSTLRLKNKCVIDEIQKCMI